MDTQCAICMCEMRGLSVNKQAQPADKFSIQPGYEDTVILLHSIHPFHSNCLKDVRSMQCPLCKKGFTGHESDLIQRSRPPEDEAPAEAPAEAPEIPNPFPPSHREPASPEPPVEPF